MVTPREIAVATQIIQDHVLRPHDNEYHAEVWRDQSEIPGSSEIMPKESKEEVRDERDFFANGDVWNDYQVDPEHNLNLPHNIVEGPWSSKEDYIAAHYQILREDAIASLRASVKNFKRTPAMFDDKLTHIYTGVHFKGLLLGALGPAFRIEFSHERAGKQIRWEQSSRLQQGTMIVLSPQRDMFRTICKVAIVAARPIEGCLDQNPPVIDIFWGNREEAVFDPVEPYVMLESRQGYFEASRHMLVALQKLRTEGFWLSKHLVELENDIGAPEWLEKQRLLDLTSLIHPEIDPTTSQPVPIPSKEEIALYNADVLQGFPSIPSTGMDESQMSACERMVTKKVSIVQGPPGTGKTFTSVSALRVMIENMGAESPPIIIAAQTNHALDQLINHVLKFEPNILRLGGRSDKENIEIQKRTLYNLRMTCKHLPNGSRGMKVAFLALGCRVNEIKMSIAPLLSEDILSDETLLAHGIITADQKESLHEEGWANGDPSTDNEASAPPLIQWLGPDQLVQIPRAPLINLGLPVEESDLEYEQLQQVEQEGEESPDKETDALSGTWIPFGRKWTGRSPAGIEERKVKKLLSFNKNLYEIPMGMRGPVYRHWEKKLNELMLAKLKDHLKDYKVAADNIKIVKWMADYKLIRHLGVKVIGCTTTGLSKYRGLLASLHPRTLLIEEAAETLEGTVMAGMFESLEQLILVGDHQQLQANATIRALEQKPFHLSISMFERLVNNSIGYTMLNLQRRMIPDVRKLLCIEPKPFYSNLQDHPSVLERRDNRAPVPGMGGKDTYFFHHTWPEGKNADQSRYNTDEAEMIAGFFNHLVMNGTEFSKITVLTFYNGQRKAILKELKRHPSIGGNTYFNVFTVDSYQGEENDVILLSLVRSNEYMGIGFLENKNRLVVALSRARRGLYIFGNAVTLTTSETQDETGTTIREPLWEPVIGYMRDHSRFDLEGGLPITCANHGKTIRIEEAADWYQLAGGCNQLCPANLSCGHQCPHPCHPFDHSRVICAKPCTKTLICGHGCATNCGEECYCGRAICMAEADMKLGNDYPEQESYDMPVSGAGILGSPTKNDSARNPNPRRNNTTTARTLNKTTFASHDMRNGMDRQSSRRNFSSSAAAGNIRPNQGIVGGARNGSFPAGATMANRSRANPYDGWNAKEADKAVSEEILRKKAASPQIDRSTLVFNERYRAVKVQNGVRVNDPASSTQRIIQRVDTSPLASLIPQSAESSLLLASTTKPAVVPKKSAHPSTTAPPMAPVPAKSSVPSKSTNGVSSNTFVPSTTRYPPSQTATSSKTVASKVAAPINPAGSAKNTAQPNGATPKSAAAPKSVASSNKNVAPQVYTRSTTVYGNGLDLKNKEADIEVLKKKLTHAKAALDLKKIVRQTQNVAASPNTLASNPSTLRVADHSDLLNFDYHVAVPQRTMSSSLADLFGLRVDNTPSDPFGNADDFDEFEKQFM